MHVVCFLTRRLKCILKKEHPDILYFVFVVYKSFDGSYASHFLTIRPKFNIQIKGVSFSHICLLFERYIDYIHLVH